MKKFLRSQGSIKKKLPSITILLIPIFILLLISQAVAATGWEIFPSNPEVGDTLKINGTVLPNEELTVQISFEKTAAVSDSQYKYSIDKVEISAGTNNLFTVRAEKVQNLNVNVKKWGILKFHLGADASGGVATVSQGHVPSGTYAVSITGDAQDGESTVDIKVTAQQTIQADSDGNFEYSYDTSTLPAGDFEVTVGETTKTITLNATSLAANFTAYPESGVEPLTVQFNDSSTGNITNWYWTFGDGSNSSEQNPVHTYNNAGTYNVSLKVANQYEENTTTKINFITVNSHPAPIANFTVSPSSGSAPLPVQFTDTSTNNPTNWTWNFGDGNTSTERNPTHIYYLTGVYTVNLTVKSNYGQDTKTDVITVTPLSSPIANFTTSPSSGSAPLTVQFNDTSANNPTNWTWNFGDGNSSTERNPVHTYSLARVYTVNLTVTNAYGNDTKTDVINVTSPSSPVTILANLTLNNDTLLFADPSAGNWIELSGGNPLLLPDPLRFQYTGVNRTDYQSTNLNIELELNISKSGAVYSKEIEYPYSTHPIYTEAGGKNNVTMKFNGSSDFAGKNASVYLIRTNSSEVLDGFSKLEDSNISHYNDLLNTTFKDYTKYPAELLDTNGDLSLTLGSQPAGHYVVLVLLDNAGSNFLLSATAFEVLPYEMSLTTPASVKLDSNIPINISVAGPELNYTYVGFLVKKENYRAEIGVESNGSREGTNLSLNGVNLVSGIEFPSEINTINDVLNIIGVNSGNFQNLTEGIFENVVYIKEKRNNNTKMNLDFSGHAEGDYVLFMAALNPGEGINGIVGVSQTEFTLGEASPSEPIASFTASPNSGSAPLTVQFTDTSANSPTNWSWDFGDGENSTEQNPSHIYTTTGSYNVTLNVSNQYGWNLTTQYACITVSSSSSSSSSGGSGGGGGGSSISPYTSDEITVKEITQSYTSAGEPFKVTFKDEKNVITEVVLTPKVTAGKVSVTVTMLNGVPDSIGINPVGEIFQVFDLDVTKNLGSKLESGEVTFKITEEWLDSLGEGYTITFQHFEDGKWVECPIQTSPNDAYTFIASIDSCSPFAITAVKAEEGNQSGEITSSGEQAEGNKTISNVGGEETKTEEKNWSTTLKIGGILIGLVVLILIGMAISKNKKNNK